MFGGSGWTTNHSTLQNIEAAVEFAIRPLAEFLRTFLQQYTTLGCDDTGVLLVMPKVMLELGNYARAERFSAMLRDAINGGKMALN
jgi:hypothetical protein